MAQFSTTLAFFFLFILKSEKIGTFKQTFFFPEEKELKKPQYNLKWGGILQNVQLIT